MTDISRCQAEYSKAYTHQMCFNKAAHRRSGRVHLPVAPRCNVQCKFCNRQFDCVNESRPGVTSAVLTPPQAMVYLGEVLRQKPNIQVVGIAGPGDPLANPERTFETFRQLTEKAPDIKLCVSTNGLSLPEQVPDNLNAPENYEPWRQQWGDIATPLLWSHAMFIISESVSRPDA